VITVGVRDLRRKGGPTLDIVERTVTPRLGYRAVTYKNCEYRIQWPEGPQGTRRIKPGRPFIDVQEPIRCRGESWEKPAGRQRRTLCADYKRNFKFSKMRNNRRDAGWWLSRARWLKCPWRSETRRRRR
jgi:hypothetical protein